MNNPKLMTPGPTRVRENVRLARALDAPNPDLDMQFFDFYRETCDRIAQILQTRHAVRILSGEGILGLEAACASLTEPGDRVLVVDNGIFGEGFGDFVKIYGGTPVSFKGDRTRPVDPDALAAFLEKDADFKYATLVHCDTPSGILDDMGRLCPLLKQKGILTVVDSVAGMGGEEVRTDEWRVDLMLGGSQKCFSAPPGLTFLSISPDAFAAMAARKTPIASFYCNLLMWKDYYEKKWFPYTMPASDIMGLRMAVDNILAEGTGAMAARHARIALAVRRAVTEAGLSLYVTAGWSAAVTAIEIPPDLNDADIRACMADSYNVMIAGSLGYLSGKVIRIGHMGENATVDAAGYTLFALQRTLARFGFKCRVDMDAVFREEVGKLS